MDIKFQDTKVNYVIIKLCYYNGRNQVKRTLGIMDYTALSQS